MIDTYSLVGGVTHCRSHCGLAKFRGLMYRGKIQRCDWSESPFFICAQHEF
jgi:hypothetical protein